MGKTYKAQFGDGTERYVADFSMGRAKLFYKITKLLEELISHPSGLSDDAGQDEHEVAADLFVRFFQHVWDVEWLADCDASFVSGWLPWAAGIVENITLEPVIWIDRNGKSLNVRRYTLHDLHQERLIQSKNESGNLRTVASASRNTNITV